MNWLESKIARMKIRRRWYYYQRREMMIERANGYLQEAKWHYGDSHPGKYVYYVEMETRYRRRAAWYLQKMAKASRKPVKF